VQPSKQVREVRLLRGAIIKRSLRRAHYKGLNENDRGEMAMTQDAQPGGSVLTNYGFLAWLFYGVLSGGGPRLPYCMEPECCRRH